MPSSKNPCTVIDVPQEIIDLALKNSGIVCNLRINQQPDFKSKSEDERRLWEIEACLYDTFNFYRKMEEFLRSIAPRTRMVLICQGFGRDIFSLVTDVERIFWADNKYPRIDFEKRSRVIRKVFGHSNLWGGFILAAARVGKVKKEGRLGYDLLFELAGRPGGIINPYRS